ncbi:hypothetical protein CH333_04110, partial [candidate division WOR-3 bacterium JGI_Cruoil_03_44_89]
KKQLSFALLRAVQKIKPDDPLKIVFDFIDWSFIPPLVEKFYSSQGNEAYNPVSIFKCFLLPYFGEARSMNDVAEKLKFDTRLQFLCGFYDGNTPSSGTFSNHKSKWKDDTFYKIMRTLIAQLVAIGVLSGKNIAIDSSHIFAYSNPKKQSDPDARWGCKHEDYYFFGYKIHLVVDTETQLPIDAIVTPGNKADSPYAKPLIKGTKELVSPETAAMDAAYDAHDNYQACVGAGITPIIDFNKRGKKPLPKDPNLFSVLKVPSTGSDLSRIGNNFFCPATNLRLVRDGKDSQRANRQKILCKHKNCPLSSKCKPLKGHGRTFYVYPTCDIRLYGDIPRDSDEWKLLYNLRTSVERCFSELKGQHLLERPKVRGIVSTSIHAFLSIIALLLKRLKDFLLQEKLKTCPAKGGVGIVTA